MNDALEQRVTELQRSFDASFALPAKTATEDTEGLLLISVSGDNYAVRLRELSAIAQSPQIVEVPSQAPGLLGVAGMRGSIVPVFRLATLLGYGANEDGLSWVIVCGATEPMAFAFQGFEGYVSVERSLLRASEAEQRRGYVEELFVTPSGPRPVVAITKIVAAIRRRTEDAGA